MQSGLPCWQRATPSIGLLENTPESRPPSRAHHPPPLARFFRPTIIRRSVPDPAANMAVRSLSVAGPPAARDVSAGISLVRHWSGGQTQTAAKLGAAAQDVGVAASGEHL